MPRDFDPLLGMIGGHQAVTSETGAPIVVAVNGKPVASRPPARQPETAPPPRPRPAERAEEQLVEVLRVWTDVNALREAPQGDPAMPHLVRAAQRLYRVTEGMVVQYREICFELMAMTEREVERMNKILEVENVDSDAKTREQ